MRLYRYISLRVCIRVCVFKWYTFVCVCECACLRVLAFMYVRVKFPRDKDKVFITIASYESALQEPFSAGFDIVSSPVWSALMWVIFVCVCVGECAYVCNYLLVQSGEGVVSPLHAQSLAILAPFLMHVAGPSPAGVCISSCREAKPVMYTLPRTLLTSGIFL